MTDPHWTLDPDHKTVTLTIPANPSVAVKFDVAAIDEILKNLGAFRAAMAPEVARENPLGRKVEAVPDPIWFTQPEALQGDSLLHIRDPRFGWLHYLIPRHEASKLGTLLLAQSQQPPTPTPDQTN